MKLKLEATAAEMHERGESLIKALAHELAPVRPDLAEELRKAVGITPFVSDARYLSLRQLETQTHEAYVDQVNAMMTDIHAVLDEAEKGATVQKAVPDEVRERVVNRLVAEGHGTAESLARLDMKELLQKAAQL